MARVALIVDTPDGPRRVAVSGERTTLGRGESATVRLDDDALSRIHATVYSESGRLWIVDEGSTNGTFVNGRAVPSAGHALADGDRITLGHGTLLTVEASADARPKPVARRAAASTIPRGPVVASVALVTIAAIAGGIGFLHRAGTETVSVVPAEPPVAVVTTVVPDEQPAAQPEAVAPVAPEIVDSLDASTVQRYSEMSEAEKVEFIDRESRRISKMLGTRSYAFTDDVIHIIKKYLDGYASRGRSTSTKTWGEGLPTLYGRATKYAPMVNRAFRQRGLSPVVGLYIVMIESEYRECLTSPAGAKGMFQFMAATARGYGVDADERCNVELMAPVCAHYMSDLIAEFGSDSLSVALAIASYNRGEGGIRTDIHKALDSQNRERSFWTLVANEERLPAGFQNENIKYVPKFFAAAIVGENPGAFGLDIRPLSTYVD